jgi:hypothetical protein
MGVYPMAGEKRNASGRFEKKKGKGGGRSSPAMPKDEARMAKTRSARVEEKRDGVHLHVPEGRQVHVHPHARREK